MEWTTGTDPNTSNFFLNQVLSQIQIQPLSLCPSVCFSTLLLPLIYNRLNQSPVTSDLNSLFLVAEIRSWH
uniref:Uncharacterized protein n=1 Tax=Salix viminalis TaxID=40686 RepID=A0A6N2KWU5_SALVM